MVIQYDCNINEKRSGMEMETHREETHRHVTTDTEIGVSISQGASKIASKHEELEEAWKGYLLYISEGTWPYPSP